MIYVPMFHFERQTGVDWTNIECFCTQFPLAPESPLYWPVAFERERERERESFRPVMDPEGCVRAEDRFLLNRLLTFFRRVDKSHTHTHTSERREEESDDRMTW